MGLSAQAARIILHRPLAFIGMTLWSFFYLCWVPIRAPLAQVLGSAWAWQITEAGSVRVEVLLRQLRAGNFLALRSIFAQEFNSTVILASLAGAQLLMIGFIWIGVIFAVKRHASVRSQLGLCVLLTFATAIITLLLASGPEAYARYRVPGRCRCSRSSLEWGGLEERRSRARFNFHP